MIRILPEILSNQIAAGEVVQRPASVVKELVENSIDAGADRITVNIEKGGKSLIRVSDNGSGLPRDQALLAIERYATSKIFTKEDLFAIDTFGFRGEALPSIASVSRFCLVTRPHEADTATRVEMAGGELVQVSDTGAPVGAMVEVRHLFFNTPARRKFLKADTTEAGHIADTLSGMALGNPGVGFRLFSGRKLIKHFPPGQDLLHRAMLVLGKDVAGQLYPINHGAGAIHISGACANPAVTRATAGRIYLFVNHRLVHDRGVVSAVFKGFAGRIMKGRFPVAVVCCDLPCDQVDVNVHPSKREIKFLAPQPVYQAVSAAVNAALMTAQRQVGAYTGSLHRPGPGVSPPSKPSPLPVPPAPVYEPESPGRSDRIQESRQHADRGFQAAPRVLGQTLGTYIIAEQAGALMLVDQHAAHERVVYEALKQRHGQLQKDSQYLLVPETLEFSSGEADLLSGILTDLADLGLVIEPFGGSTFVIKAVPGLLGQKSIQSLVTGIVDTFMETGDLSVKEQWLDACLISMACHHAIQAGKSMTFQEMETLITDLFACDNPLHCPHGRPTVVTFDRYRMEKLFKRVA